jgi:hypothetical protein
MSTETKLIAPKKGEHARDAPHEGVLEVVFVNALMQRANIRWLDRTGHVVITIIARPGLALRI